MRILFDQGTPVPLRRGLTGHTISTAYEMDWTELDNGALLRAAAVSFDALITTDKNLRFQQNLTGRRLAILVLPTTSCQGFKFTKRKSPPRSTRSGRAMSWS